MGTPRVAEARDSERLVAATASSLCRKAWAVVFTAEQGRGIPRAGTRPTFRVVGPGSTTDRLAPIAVVGRVSLGRSVPLSTATARKGISGALVQRTARRLQVGAPSSRGVAAAAGGLAAIIARVARAPGTACAVAAAAAKEEEAFGEACRTLPEPTSRDRSREDQSPVTAPYAVGSNRATADGSVKRDRRWQ